MKRLQYLFLIAGAALAGASMSCGDNGVRCGEGTTAQDGFCVADPVTPIECGTGTVLMGGECVPDGSVVCEQGTRFDTATGTCVVDPSACANGTTLVNGECVPDDELLMGSADHVETAEPNEMTGAGVFSTPALDASTTFYGCVTARVDADMDGNLDADVDPWVINASGPMVLEITADGIGGLSAGFVARSADMAHSPTLDNWARIGINLTGDTAKREIYLPAAGRYVLLVTDARSLFLGQAGAGNASTCYFATVKHVATPAPVALGATGVMSTDTGKVKIYTATADAPGDLFDVTLNGVGPALSPAFVSLRGTAIHRSAVVDNSGPTPIPPGDTIGGLNNADVVSIVVDSEFNYGLTPQDFTIDLVSVNAQPLPTAGGMITVTNANDGAAPLTFPELNYSYFDVATAGIVRFALTPSIATDMMIVRQDLFTPAGALDIVAQIDGFGAPGRAAFTGEFVKFLQPGRYYFLTLNPAATMTGGTYTITSTLTPVTPTAITYGTALNGQALATTFGLHTLDLTNPVWIEQGVTATTDWGTGQVAIDTYDLAQGGWLRNGTPPTTIPPGNLYPAFASTQVAVAPFAPTGRIVAGDTRDHLVRIRPTADPGPAATYSVLFRDRPNVVNLGMQAPGAPTMQTITALTNGAPARFIVTGAAGNTVRAVNTPAVATADIRILRLNANETTAATVDAGLLGAAETLAAPVPAAPNNWVAWVVDNKTVGTPTDVAQVTTVVQPRPYTITTGTLAFNDACVGTGSTVIGMNRDDEVATAQTLPAAFSAFQLFGEAVPANHRVGSNGWISWDTGTVSFGAYQNQMIPTGGAPNGLIGPFWQDLDQVTLCRKDDLTAGSESVTYQWTGRVYQQAAQVVQFQLVLRASGVVDFIYGPMHVSNGAFADTDGNGATVGMENLGGNFGHQVHYNTASVMPNTSRTLTPM